MVSTVNSKNLSRYYALILSTFTFIAIFILLAMVTKHYFATGARPTQTVEAKGAPPPSGIAGRYVGFTTLQTGICSVGAHEFIIQIADDGNAQSDYGMRADGLLRGRAGPDGKIHLTFHDEARTVSFVGEIRQGHITGRSYVSTDRTCDIPWELWRS